MYKTMKLLIEKKFYNTQEEAQQKLDVFYAMSKLSDEEYVELTMLAEQMYAPVVEDLPEDEVVAELEVPVE